MRRDLSDALTAHRRRGRFGCACGYPFASSSLDDAAILDEHDRHLADALTQLAFRGSRMKRSGDPGAAA